MKQMLARITLISYTLLNGVVFADTLDQGKLLFNQKQYQQAYDLLSELSEQGDANATFWLGVTQYKMGQRFEAGDTMLQAAEMGDPWAMGVLGGGVLYLSPPCEYMGWACDDVWKDKAIKIWELQSKQGNGKAAYARDLSKRDWWEYIPFYNSKLYQKQAKLGVDNGGYRYLNYSLYWESTEKKIEALNIAANKGYAPAMRDLYYEVITTDRELAEQWINQAIELGYANAARTLYLVYSQGHGGVKPSTKKAYYYNRLSGILGGEERESHKITHQLKLDEQGQLVKDADGQILFDVLITKEDQAELDKQVEEFAKDIKPNMFLDEISKKLF